MAISWKSVLLILALSVIFSCGPRRKDLTSKDVSTVMTTIQSVLQDSMVLAFDSISYSQTTMEHEEDFVDTEFEIGYSHENMVIIQNSFPKGGGDIDGIRGYYDSDGRHYGYRIFWSRILNRSKDDFKFSLTFPAESYSILGLPDAYLKLFLPPDTMTIEKLPLYNYGITGLKVFLDTHFDQPSNLHRTIGPGEEVFFFVGMLLHVPQQKGAIRTAIIPDGMDLSYRISIDPIGSAVIPCGRFSYSRALD